MQHDITLLLHFEHSGTRCHLRIDTDPFGVFAPPTPPVLAITFDVEPVDGAALTRLEASVGLPCESEAWPPDSRPFELELHLNYAAEPLIIVGRSFSALREQRTTGDDAVRMGFLRRALEESEEEALRLGTHLRQLRQSLTTHLQHTLENSQRKAEFFRSSHPDQAAVAAARAELCEHVLGLLERSKENGAA